MNSFTLEQLKRSIPPHLSWLLSQCAEARGKQDLWTATKPEALKTLKEMAVIQSVESSNRIEGVVVSPSRLKPLVLADAKPMDRPEEEIVGYKRALNSIHANFNSVAVDATTIKKVHLQCLKGMNEAGEWKTSNNEIIEISAEGDRSVRFVPVDVASTPKMIDQLCLAYRDTLKNSQSHDMIAISSFILDFLCIHPFRDGNGRLARLFSTLLLHKNRYNVGAYISLERLIEESKEEYYEALKISSINWHNATHDPVPWHQYFCSIVKQAYRDLEDRVQKIDDSASKSEIVRRVVLEFLGEFSITEIEMKVPNISRAGIKKTLSQLRDEGLIELKGKGRSARWVTKIR